MGKNLSTRLNKKFEAADYKDMRALCNERKIKKNKEKHNLFMSILWSYCIY